MHPKELKIEDYSYVLPEDKIAQFPKPHRDESKLLVYEKGAFSEDIYRNIAQYIPANSLVIFNQTKVVPVRLLFQKATGATIEIFCLEPDVRYADMQTAMSQRGTVYWNCLVGGANKWKAEIILSHYDEDLKTDIEAQVIERKEGAFLIQFTWANQQFNFAEVLQAMGKVPLPPYMNRAMQEEDKERYQTVYAREEGSVAAPTAGLHFTPAIFEQFSANGIQTDFLTLHVGAGTFKQVKSETIGEHDMHAEWIEVSYALIQKLQQQQGLVVAIGTTSMRTLESLYWIGLKIHLQQKIDWEGIAVQQWDPYELVADIDVSTALQHILDWMEEHQLQKIITRTQIIIAPGYTPKMVQTLVTNFHQPHSTLLLLIAALMGNDWKLMYQYALEHEFRFLSYGDGCLIQFGA